MIYLIFISIVLLTLSDWLNWKYNRDGGIWLTELSKIALLGSIASIFATGFIGLEKDHVIAWIFLLFSKDMEFYCKTLEKNFQS